MISIIGAAATGIDRLRIPKWADPMDHIKIDIIDGKPGPWAHLFAPFNKECNGRDPVDILCLAIAGKMTIDPFVAEWEPYTGPLPDSDAYKARVASFSRIPGDQQ